MRNAGGKAIAAAYQTPPPPAADTARSPGAPRCSIVTSHNMGEPVLYPDESSLCAHPLPTPRRAQQHKKAPRAIRKTTYSDLNLKRAPAPLPDLKAMDKYVDSPLALSRFDPTPFLDDFVFDNTPSISLHNELQQEDRFWPPPSRSVETSPSSSVSAISPVGTSPLWPPVDRCSPSLIDVFENLRPFSSRFYWSWCPWRVCEDRSVDAAAGLARCASASHSYSYYSQLGGVLRWLTWSHGESSRMIPPQVQLSVCLLLKGLFAYRHCSGW